MYIGLFGFVLGTLAAWIIFLLRRIRGPSDAMHELPGILGMSTLPLAAFTYCVGTFLFVPIVILFGQTALLLLTWGAIFQPYFPW
jgi:hypothetical protein